MRRMTTIRNGPTSSPCGSTERAMINRSVLIALGSIILLLNLVEIIMIAKLKKKKIYEIILLSLSVSDCLFGLSNVIVSSIFLSNSCRFEDFLESPYVLYLIFVLSSIFHLTFIALDRVILVLKPIKHKFIFTKKIAYRSVATIWAITIIISVSLFIRYELTETTEENVAAGGDGKKFESDMQFLLSVFLVITDTLMIMCYSIVVYVTSIQKKKVRSISEKNNRLPIICLFIGATFIFCTFPFATARFATGEIKFWANVILIINSGMNSIIYFFRGRLEKIKCVKKKEQELRLNEINYTKSETTS